MRPEFEQLLKYAVSRSRQDRRVAEKNAELNMFTNSVVGLTEKSLKAHVLKNNQDNNDERSDDELTINSDPDIFVSNVTHNSNNVSPAPNNNQYTSNTTVPHNYSAPNSRLNSQYNTENLFGDSSRLSDFDTPLVQNNNNNLSNSIENTNVLVYEPQNPINLSDENKENITKTLFQGEDDNASTLSDNEKQDYALSAAAIISIYARYYVEINLDEKDEFSDEFTSQDFQDLETYFKTNLLAAKILCDSFTEKRSEIEQWYKDQQKQDSRVNYLSRWEIVREETYRNRLKAVLASDQQSSMQLRCLSGASAGAQKQEELHLEDVLMPYAMYQIADTVYVDINDTFKENNNRLVLAREKALKSSFNHYISMRRLAEKVISELCNEGGIHVATKGDMNDVLLNHQNLASALVEGSFMVMQDYGSRTPKEMSENNPLLTVSRAINGQLFMKRYLLPYCAERTLSQLDVDEIKNASYVHAENVSEEMTITSAMRPLIAYKKTTESVVGHFIGRTLIHDGLVTTVDPNNIPSKAEPARVLPFHYVSSAAAIVFINAEYFLSFLGAGVLKELLKNTETQLQDISHYFAGHQEDARRVFNAFMDNRPASEAWYEKEENAADKKTRQEKWKKIRIDSFKNRIQEQKKNPEKQSVENPKDQFLEQVLVPYAFYQSSDAVYENLKTDNTSNKSAARVAALKSLEQPFLDVYNAAVEALGINAFDHEACYTLAQIPMKLVIAHDLKPVSSEDPNASSKTFSRKIHKIFIENYFNPYVKESIKNDVTKAPFVQTELTEPELIADAFKKTKEYYAEGALTVIKTQLTTMAALVEKKWMRGSGHRQLIQLIEKINTNAKNNNLFAHGRIREYAREAFAILHGYPELVVQLKTALSTLSIEPDYKVYAAAKRAFIYVSTLGTKKFKAFDDVPKTEREEKKTWCFEQWLDYFNALGNVEKIEHFLAESNWNEAQLANNVLSKKATENTDPISTIEKKKKEIKSPLKTYYQTINEEFSKKINGNTLDCLAIALDFYAMRHFLHQSQGKSIEIIKLNPAMTKTDLEQMMAILKSQSVLLDFRGNKNLSENDWDDLEKQQWTYMSPEAQEHGCFLKCTDTKNQVLNLSSLSPINAEALISFLKKVPTISKITFSHDMTEKNIDDIIERLKALPHHPFINFNKNPAIDEKKRTEIYDNIHINRIKRMEVLQKNLRFIHRMIEIAKAESIDIKELFTRVQKEYRKTTLTLNDFIVLQGHHVMASLNNLSNQWMADYNLCKKEQRIFSLRAFLAFPIHQGFETIIADINNAIETGDLSQFEPFLSKAQDKLVAQGKPEQFLDWWTTQQNEAKGRMVGLTELHFKKMVKPILFIYRDYLKTVDGFQDIASDLKLEKGTPYKSWDINTLSLQTAENIYHYFLENRSVIEAWYKKTSSDYTAYWKEALTEEYVSGLEEARAIAIKTGKTFTFEPTRAFNEKGGMEDILAPYEIQEVFNGFGENVQSQLPINADEQKTIDVIQTVAAQGMKIMAACLLDKFMEEKKDKNDQITQPALYNTLYDRLEKLFPEVAENGYTFELLSASPEKTKEDSVVYVYLDINGDLKYQVDCNQGSLQNLSHTIAIDIKNQITALQKSNKKSTKLTEISPIKAILAVTSSVNHTKDTTKQQIVTSFAGVFQGFLGESAHTGERTPIQRFAPVLFNQIYSKSFVVDMGKADSLSVLKDKLRVTKDEDVKNLNTSWNKRDEYQHVLDATKIEEERISAGLSNEFSLNRIFSQQNLAAIKADIAWNVSKEPVKVDGNLVVSTSNVFKAPDALSDDKKAIVKKDLPRAANGRQIQINKADIHGNFLLLIQTLRDLGVVTLEKEHLQRLIELEAAFDVYGDAKIIDKQLAKMEEIIARHLKLNPEYKKNSNDSDSKAAILRLIGDDRDDRGLLDYLTACVCDVLEGTPEDPGLEIVRLHSDHADMGFRPESNEAKKDQSKVRSGTNTQLLIKRGIIVEERLEKWNAFEKRYKQSLKLMDYAIQMDNNGKPTALTLFSHGAVEQECLKALAQYFEVAYFDHNALALCQTIDAVNAKFNEMMSSVQGLKDYAAMMEAFDSEMNENFPGDVNATKFEINVFSESDAKAIALKKKYPVLWVLWSYKSDKTWQLGDQVPVTPICGHAASQPGKVYTNDDGICLDAKAGMINRVQEISSITVLNDAITIDTEADKNTIKNGCNSIPMLYLKKRENQSSQYVFVYKDENHEKQQIFSEINQEHYLYEALKIDNNELGLTADAMGHYLLNTISTQNIELKAKRKNVLSAFQNLLSERHQDIFSHKIGTRENDLKLDKDNKIAATNKILVASSYPSLSAMLQPIMQNVETQYAKNSGASRWKLDFIAFFNKFKAVVGETSENAILAQLAIALQQLCELKATTKNVDEHEKYADLLICFDDALDLFKRKEWEAAKAAAGFVSEVVSALGKHHHITKPYKERLAKKNSSDDSSSEHASVSTNSNHQHNQQVLQDAMSDANFPVGDTSVDVLQNKLKWTHSLCKNSIQPFSDDAQKAQKEIEVANAILVQDLNVAINRAKPVLSLHRGIFDRCINWVRSLIHWCDQKKALTREARHSWADAKSYKDAEKTAHAVSTLFQSKKAIGEENTLEGYNNSANLRDK